MAGVDKGIQNGGSMSEELQVGARLYSVVCSTEVVVVKAGGTPVDLRCGGLPLVETPTAEKVPLVEERGEPTLLGKRYVDDGTGIELLAVKPGDGALSVEGRPMVLKGAKPLPASD